MTTVRTFARGDREQLTRLANVHIAAVLPGWSVPAAALLARLEREPGEYIVDPWVTERTTLVAVERDRVAAAAHLKRYAGADHVSDDYRDAGEIAWMLCWPDHTAAGRAVMGAAVARLDAWGVRIQYADGSLPVTYGVSDAWPHVATLYTEAGFGASDRQVELMLVGSLAQVVEPGPAPVDGLALQRRVGTLGTAFHAVLDGEDVGIFEVDDNLAAGGSMLRLAGWADECNHRVREDLRGRGIGSWLFRHGAEWLRLGGTTRLIAYLVEDDHTERGLAYYARHGLTPLNRTTRGWTRHPPALSSK